MEPAAEPRSAAKQQYENVRQSLAVFEERVIARYWDEDALARASFERFVGSLDRFAGWLLADDEISRRGQALMRTRHPASPTKEELRSNVTGDEQEHQDKQQARDEAGQSITAGQANATEEEHAGTERAAEQPSVPDPPAAKGSPVNVTFTLPAEVQADSVVLCGEFNLWSVEDIQLARGSDGTWRAVVALESGRSYRYRYLLDGERWENAWQADRYVPNPHGSVDSVIIVEPPPES
jgi:hypothetical protein